MINNKAQGEKLKHFSACANHKAQEEMVGFALIVVIVSVILLILISIIIMRQDKNQSVQSYEAESFIQSILSYTTDCADLTNNHLSLEQVIFSCIDNKDCIDGQNSCDLLNNTIKGIIKESWGTNQRPTAGFKFSIFSQSAPLIIEEGNFTGNSRTAIQPLIKAGNDINISLEIYG